MNPFDALIEKKTVEQRREWMEPVKRNGRDLRGRLRNSQPFLAGAVVVDRAGNASLRGVLVIDFGMGP